MNAFDWWSFLADTLGVITALVAVPAVIRYLFQERKRKKEADKIRKGSNGTREAVLAVGLGERALMESQVKVFLNANSELVKRLEGKLQNGSNFFLLEKKTNLPEPAPGQNTGYSAKADKYLDDVIVELNQLMIRMAEQGVGKIHLFYQGPTVLATVVGAALSNRYQVVCYHYSRNTGYYSVGLMQGVGHP